MKKAYVAPATGVYNIDCVSNIMSGSVMSISDTTVDTSEDGGVNQLGREDNAISNIWDSEW